MYKKVFLLAVLCIFSISVFAQKDVTKFLGIPIDGTKTEMLNKIKAKGFTKSSYGEDWLEGEFNGKDVYISVVCNRGKVYRVVVMNQNSYNEINAKIQFNRLCEQFMNNGKYVSFSTLEEMQIPNDENIDYEITVNDKRYEAAFYQNTELDSAVVAAQLQELIYAKYTEEQLEEPSEEILSDVISMSVDYAFKLVENKLVWFMLSEKYGAYSIVIYYDNEYNKAHGEDL